MIAEDDLHFKLDLLLNQVTELKVKLEVIESVVNENKIPPKVETTNHQKISFLRFK